MALPQGVVGWTVLATGLLIILYRVYGIVDPRAWVEWVERQFTYAVNLRFIGGILLAVAVALGYFGGPPIDLLSALFVACIVLLGLVGLGLLLLQNHTRHIIFATAESSDLMIRIVSGVVVAAGLALMLAPFVL